MSDVLAVAGVTCGYGDGPPVLRKLDLTVGSGEVVALIGPNGAGKTTTLCAISGLLRPRAGSIMLLERSVVGVTTHRIARMGVAHVPDDRGIFGSLTVRENLSLRRRAAHGIAMVLDYFPALEPLLGRRAGVLSGGEQQMLAVGRALVARPKLLLIDEMSHGLAPVIVERLLPLVKRIALDLQCGVVIVEQHVRLALETADRGYVLNHGRIVASGAAAAILADATRLEAAYLGAAPTSPPKGPR